MAQNKGLGRGLASLLGMNELDVKPVQTEIKQESVSAPTTAKNEGAQAIISDKGKKMMNLVDEKASKLAAPEHVQLDPSARIIAIQISIKDIDPNYEQPRKHFDEAALNDLAESIKIHGVIQPIVVVRMGMRFMIIAGERRFRAAKMAGLNTIPAIIKNYSPQQIREISLIENLQREDLNPIEAARAIKQLMEEFNMTQETAFDSRQPCNLSHRGRQTLRGTRSRAGSHRQPNRAVQSRFKGCRKQAFRQRNGKAGERAAQSQARSRQTTGGLSRAQRACGKYAKNLRNKGRRSRKRQKGTHIHRLLHQRRFGQNMRACQGLA